MQNNIISPRTNFKDIRDNKTGLGKVQITNINVKASARQNLQDILGTRGRQDGYSSADLQLDARNSSSNTADHYEQKYLNVNIDEDTYPSKGDATGYASNPTAQLNLLKEGSNQLDIVSMDKSSNFRSFEQSKKPANDQSRENSVMNQLAVPQVYEGTDLNNIILSNDFTAYNNYQDIKNQKTSFNNEPKLRTSNDRSSQNTRDSKLQKQRIDENYAVVQRESRESFPKNPMNNNGTIPISQQSSGQTQFQSPLYSKSQKRLSENTHNRGLRVSSQAISDKSESVRGGGISKKQVGKSNPNDYYMTNQSPKKAMKQLPAASRNATTSQVSSQNTASYEAGSVYKSEFSANKQRLEKSTGPGNNNGLGQQNSIKSESNASRNDSGFVPQERPEYAKYYELVKKRSQPVNLENIGDEDVTLNNDALSPLTGKASMRHQGAKSPRKNEKGRYQNVKQSQQQAKQDDKQQYQYNAKKPQNNTLKKSATSAQLSASKRKQQFDNGPFQKTEAMLMDPQQVSVLPPESDAYSQSQRPQKRKKNDVNGKQQDPQIDKEKFLKSNIGDFKQKILGAMQSTNQAVQNAGKKPDGLEGPLSNDNKYDNSQRELEKIRSPSANQYIKPQKTSLMVPDSQFPVANSENQNTFDFYKSGEFRELQDEQTNNNSEVQFRATERSQHGPQYSQQEPTQPFQSPNDAPGSQQEMKIEDLGAIEINKDDLDDLYKQSEKLGEQIKLRNNQDNLTNLNVLSHGSDSNLGGPFPNRYDRFQSPHQDVSHKIQPYAGSKSIQGGGQFNRLSRYQRSTSKYSQANNQFDKQSRAYTSSKIDELMKNQKIQEILLEPNDQFEHLLLSDHNNNPEGDDAQNHNNDIEAKVETLLTLLNNFMLRHGVTSINVPGQSSNNDIDDQQKSQATDGFTQQEQFLLNAIDKLSNYIEVLQARETAQKHQQIKSGISNETQRFDYPGTAATPNSMFAGNQFMNQLSPNAMKDLQKLGNNNSPDQNVYQKLALAEVKMKRLIGQISEMNIEYKCQKTQVEALEKFNDSLNNQIKRLEQKLHETQSQFHNQQTSKHGSGVFGGGLPSAERTPRQMMIEQKLRQRDLSIRSRERLNSLQLQIGNNNVAKSSLELTQTNFMGNAVGPTVFSPQSTRTLIQPGHEPFKSVEVTENSAQGTLQQANQNENNNMQAQHQKNLTPTQFNFNFK